MSGYSRHQKGFRGDRRRREGGKKFENEEKQSDEEIAKSPILKAFQKYRNELDRKHDKYERLIKMSRDITIESKRIIFLLHSNVRGSNPLSVLPEANIRISKLIETDFFNIGKELDGEDPYQFVRAYYAGVQEFIEAYTFYYYLECGKLYQWEKLKNDMVYKPQPKPADVENNETVQAEPELSTVVEIKNEEPFKYISNLSDTTRSVEIEKTLKVLLTPVDYVMGVQDLTGELMRHCINSLSSGEVEEMYQTCGFVRSIYCGLSSISRIPSKEYFRKIAVLRQSLLKIENACYMVRIRGSEIPKHMLADVVTCQETIKIDEDEGFY